MRPSNCTPALCLTPGSDVRFYGFTCTIIKLDNLIRAKDLLNVENQHYDVLLKQVATPTSPEAYITWSARMPLDPVTVPLHKFNLVSHSWLLSLPALLLDLLPACALRHVAAQRLGRGPGRARPLAAASRGVCIWQPDRACRLCTRRPRLTLHAAGLGAQPRSARRLVAALAGALHHSGRRGQRGSGGASPVAPGEPAVQHVRRVASCLLAESAVSVRTRAARGFRSERRLPGKAERGHSVLRQCVWRRGQCAAETCSLPGADSTPESAQANQCLLLFLLLRQPAGRAGAARAAAAGDAAASGAHMALVAAVEIVGGCGWGGGGGGGADSRDRPVPRPPIRRGASRASHRASSRSTTRRARARSEVFERERVRCESGGARGVSHTNLVCTRGLSGCNPPDRSSRSCSEASKPSWNSSASP